MSLAHVQAAASERRVVEHGARDPKIEKNLVSARVMNQNESRETCSHASGWVSCTQPRATDRKISTCCTYKWRGPTAQTRVFANPKSVTSGTFLPPTQKC